jgi:hypothetical protein
MTASNPQPCRLSCRRASLPGRVENWRACCRWRASTRTLSIYAVGSQFHPGHVSSSRHVARSVRISRTTRSCILHLKGYEAYQAGAAFAEGRYVTRYSAKSPSVS